MIILPDLIVIRHSMRAGAKWPFVVERHTRRRRWKDGGPVSFIPRRVGSYKTHDEAVMTTKGFKADVRDDTVKP